MVETQTEPFTEFELADVIYFGGDILTMEGEAPTYVEALAVKEGKILAVGKMVEMEKYKGDSTKLFDLQGKTLLPGFVDGHSHIFSYIASMNSAQLSSSPMGPIKNIAGIIQALEEKKKELKLSDTDWLIGWGYDQNALDERRHPTAADLDLAFPTNPVLIMQVSGHMLVANAAAMKAKGINADTKNPLGGTIVRKPGSQEPEGLFQETAFQVYFVDEIIKKEPPEIAVKKLELALAYYASYGITTAHEGVLQEEQIPLVEYAASKGKLFIDLVCLVHQPAAEKLLNQKAIRWGTYNNGLKYLGMKIITDGSPQSKTAYLTEPYVLVSSGEQSSRGNPDMSQTKINELFLTFYRNRIQIFAHCNGDAAIDMIIAGHVNAIKQLTDQNIDRRTVIVHSQIMRPDQLDAYRKYGFFATFFTNHVYYWGDVHLRNLGEKRASFISPMHSAIEKGVPVANHTDYSVTPINQLFTCWTAVNRLTGSGKILGPEERITPYQALKAITMGSAYMCFEEDTKGSLKPGKIADFVILGNNPLKVEPMAIKDIQVLSTIKCGKEVYRRNIQNS